MAKSRNSKRKASRKCKIARKAAVTACKRSRSGSKYSKKRSGRKSGSKKQGGDGMNDWTDDYSWSGMPMSGNRSRSGSRMMHH